MRSIGICAFLPCLFISACEKAPDRNNENSPFDRFEQSSSKPDSHELSPVGSNLSVARETEPILWERHSTGADNVAPISFQRCGKVRFTCVVDGDTLWLEGVKIRVADIDTPEISQPKCPYEKELGELATERFIELLNAGPVTIARMSGPDEDRYGRKLRVILRDDRSLGAQLVIEGLAHEWGGNRLSWC